MSYNRLTIVIAFSVCGFVVLSGLGFFLSQQAEAGSSENISGWAWSDATGWVSFNSTDCDAEEDGSSDGNPAGCPGGNPTSGLIHYWDFNEGSGITAGDSVGGTNGALQNMDDSNWVAGPSGFGTALEFNGVDEYVLVLDDDNLSFGNGGSDTPFTMTAWVYMDDASNFFVISKVGDPGNLFDYEYRVSTATDDVLTGMLFDDFLVNFMIAGSRGIFTTEEGRWMHIAVTYDGSGNETGLDLYIDGEHLQAAYGNKLAGYVAMQNKAVNLAFGREGSAAGTFSDGKIDEIRMYNRVLTDWEVQDVYTGSPVATPVDYGVTVDTNTGELSGHAWSEQLGWISFNRAETGVPPEVPYNGSETFTACVDFASAGQSCDNANDNKVYGWARVLGACKDDLWNGSACTGSGAGDGAGGWDGWIKLRDVSFDADAVELNDITNEFEGWAWGSDVVGWMSFNSVTDGGAAHAVQLQENDPPTAGVTCSESPCEAWKKKTSINPVLTLTNTSSDPQGDGDFASSTWSEISPGSLVWGTCSGKCNHTVQVHPADTYTVQLEVEDTAGNTASTTIDVTLRQDTEADFECSLDSVNWVDCATIVPAANLVVYFQNISTASEGEAIDNALTVWSFDPDGNPLSSAGAAVASTTFPVSGQKTITLQTTDTGGRNDTLIKTIDTSLQFPIWREISPF